AVSGGCTELIADFMGFGTYIEEGRLQYVKKALYYLGSLTQFIDDFRDFYEDAKNGNSNIISALKAEHGGGWKKTFTELYLTEEKKMDEALSAAAVTEQGREMLRMLPWYRFFIEKIE
ncbi:MAG: hypothetical protein ACREBW_01650, partial [Candidatus Micrarchaeaceae archaeon]